MAGQDIERRKVDGVHPKVSCFDILTCRARVWIKRIYFGSGSLKRKLDLVRFLHRQKFIEIALKSLLNEDQVASCQRYTK